MAKDKDKKETKFRKERFIDDGVGIIIKDKNGKPVKIPAEKDKGKKKNKEASELLVEAASLPKGSPRRRAILAHLLKEEV